MGWSPSTTSTRTPASTATPSATPGVILARAVRVSRPGATDALNLVEVQLWSTAGVNVALGGSATASSVNDGSAMFAAANLLDGVLQNPGNHNHDLWHSGPGDASPWAQVTLPADAPIQRVTIYGRSDCCIDRDVGDTVQLLDAGDTVVWTATIGSFTWTGSPSLPVWTAVVSLPTPAATGSQTTSGTPTSSSTSTPTASTTRTPTASSTGTATASATRTRTPTASATRTPTASSTVTPTASVPPAAFVRVSHATSAMSWLEVVVFSLDGRNLAWGEAGANATSTLALADFPAHRATDLYASDPWSVTTVGTGVYQTSNLGSALTIRLAATQRVARVVLVSRRDSACGGDCASRASGTVVALLAPDGATVLASATLSGTRTVHVAEFAGGAALRPYLPPAAAANVDADKVRRVRLVCTKTDYLNFLEMMIFDADGYNVAAGKNTTASAPFTAAFPKERAVDGLGLETFDDAEQSMFHSVLMASPFWEVDLGGSFDVRKVVLFNRVARCEWRATLLMRTRRGLHAAPPLSWVGGWVCAPLADFPPRRRSCGCSSAVPPRSHGASVRGSSLTTHTRLASFLSHLARLLPTQPTQTPPAGWLEARSPCSTRRAPPSLPSRCPPSRSSSRWTLRAPGRAGSAPRAPASASRCSRRRRAARSTSLSAAAWRRAQRWHPLHRTPRPTTLCACNAAARASPALSSRCFWG